MSGIIKVFFSPSKTVLLLKPQIILLSCFHFLILISQHWGRTTQKHNPKSLGLDGKGRWSGTEVGKTVNLSNPHMRVDKTLGLHRARDSRSLGIRAHLIPHTPLKSGIPPGASLVLSPIRRPFVLYLYSQRNLHRSNGLMMPLSKDKGKERGAETQVYLAPSPEVNQRAQNVLSDTDPHTISKEH